MQGRKIVSLRSIIATGIGPAGFAFLWVMLWALLFATLTLPLVVPFAGGVLLGGFALALAVDLLDSPRVINQRGRLPRIASVITLCSIAVLIPAVAGGVGKEAANFVMKQLGFYAEHATVVVNNTNLVALQAAAQNSGQPLYTCRIDKDWTSVSNVQVWWYGIGSRTYVGLPKSSEKYARVSSSIGLDSTGVKVADQSIGMCAETQSGVYLDSNRAVLSNKALARGAVEDLFRRIYRADAAVCVPGDASDRGTVLITGHADPMPRARGNNIDLGLRRACVTYLYLRDELRLLTNKKAMVSDAGVAASDDQCSQSAGRIERIACEESARHADVKVFTGSSDTRISGALDADLLCPTILSDNSRNPVGQRP